MPTDRRPPGIDVFGRIDSFLVECPTCGALLVGWRNARRAKGKTTDRRRASQYNPFTSRLTCSHCRQGYGIGLLLYRIKQGAPAVTGTIPLDQRPTPRQRAILRQYEAGTWVDAPVQQGAPMNVVIDAECTCPQVEGGWRRSCPVHGWEATNARLDADAEDATPPPPARPVDEYPDDDPDDG